jgi:hypothetical protein
MQQHGRKLQQKRMITSLPVFPPEHPPTVHGIIHIPHESRCRLPLAISPHKTASPAIQHHPNASILSHSPSVVEKVYITSSIAIPLRISPVARPRTHELQGDIGSTMRQRENLASRPLHNRPPLFGLDQRPAYDTLRLGSAAAPVTLWRAVTSASLAKLKDHDFDCRCDGVSHGAGAAVGSARPPACTWFM